ncbi:MAG: hypothetical protein HF975_04535 [ANME-2 cluster archaeon]|nr:hypothetical protein [ANME-2 cluster archaeon]
MTKSPEPGRYIIFWQTKEEALPETLNKKFSILAVLLKMVLCSISVELWGRCEGVKINNELYYNGFIIFNDSHETIDAFSERYSKYITITGIHKFVTLKQTQQFLIEWKKLNK